MTSNSTPNNSPSSIHFGLNDRVCIVTGGAQGIGAACAQRFARENAKVIVSDVNDAVGKQLADSIGGTYIHCDVGNKAEVDALVKQVMAQHGRIDVLVNNAGIFKVADFLDIAEEDFDAVLRVNIKGAFLMGQAVAREMARQGSGSIINISSVVGVFGNIGQANYAATKAGLIGLTKTWAKEFSMKGGNVRVNAIAPGYTMTDILKTVPQEMLDKFAAMTMLGRLGQPHEIASAALFLASDESGYITGQVLQVDGGMRL